MVFTPGHNLTTMYGTKFTPGGPTLSLGVTFRPWDRNKKPASLCQGQVRVWMGSGADHLPQLCPRHDQVPKIPFSYPLQT
jgi:hypothetical protein